MVVLVLPVEAIKLVVLAQRIRVTLEEMGAGHPRQRLEAAEGLARLVPMVRVLRVATVVLVSLRLLLVHRSAAQVVAVETAIVAMELVLLAVATVVLGLAVLVLRQPLTAAPEAVAANTSRTVATAVKAS